MKNFEVSSYCFNNFSLEHYPIKAKNLSCALKIIAKKVLSEHNQDIDVNKLTKQEIRLILDKKQIYVKEV